MSTLGITRQLSSNLPELPPLCSRSCQRTASIMFCLTQTSERTWAWLVSYFYHIFSCRWCAAYASACWLRASLQHADRSRHVQNGQDILDSLSKLKPILVERYEKWRAYHEANGSSSQPDPNVIAQEEAARRKREELLRAQEERTRQALEAARIEDDWRRTDEQQKRVHEETEWARRTKEVRPRDTSEAQRAAEAREAAQQERIARLRADDEEERTRRRIEERRRHEQEGIFRRQQEAETAAREVRRQVASTSNGSGQSGVDADVYYRRSQEPETPTRRDRSYAASPYPSRPPSSSQQRAPNDSHGSLLSRMPVESPVPYSDDASAESRGTAWNDPRQSYQMLAKPNHANAG
ncbi:uncharacterized protein PHACADRAFT_160149 [Phanerochaete carnosa HHB-10118-sp]|uniref:Uncharacterized protein n=1 Tax=Phanerochaete carnosa (strain HHB-10118-sp) TaxID=650164 RepID=K5WCA3_PHACS|nr:uncharacterized protein PHACADRAFT_160149 [Phanerochaete carnosa HHB-10118-sp]EKM56639.1 hypothetical protein PHACADRAFT_160149 [Phanerochaete carnosa HHB-10118-sp]